MSSKKTRIESFKEFHRMVPDLVKKMNRDEKLAIRAAVNPLLAFEELGVELSREVRKQVEWIIRFSPAERKALNDLEKQIRKIVGNAVDLDSAESIEAVLFRDLKLRKPKGMGDLKGPDIVKKGRMISEKKQYEWVDSLNDIKDLHPIVKPLLAYRKIQHSRPGFVPKEMFERLKTGEAKTAITKIKVRFPESAKHNKEIENA